MAINNEPTIKPVTVTGIFTRYIAKTIPLAFDESMSYYECLCALRNYLNETIVPDINNVNNGLGELQNFYLELQNYVNTYFDNLDVQEEINNKLDEMVEDGTLQEIIGEYLNANALWCFDTVEDMKNATNLINGSYAKTLGYYSVNDGGGATYKIKSDEPSNYYEELNDNLYAELIVIDKLNIKTMGCYGDNIHDDTLCLKRAIELFSNIYIPEGTYLISQPIEINKRINLIGDGKFRSVLKYTATENEEYILTLNLARSYIKGLSLIGPYPYNSEEDTTGYSDRKVSCLNINTQYTYIEDVYIRSFYNGIRLSNGWCTTIDNCFIGRCFAGVNSYSTTNNNNVRIDKTQIEHNQHGLHLGQGRGYSINESDIELNDDNNLRNNGSFSFINTYFEDVIVISEGPSGVPECVDFIGCSWFFRSELNRCIYKNCDGKLTLINCVIRNNVENDTRYALSLVTYTNAILINTKITQGNLFNISTFTGINIIDNNIYNFKQRNYMTLLSNNSETLLDPNNITNYRFIFNTDENAVGTIKIPVLTDPNLLQIGTEFNIVVVKNSRPSSLVITVNDSDNTGLYGGGTLHYSDLTTKFIKIIYLGIISNKQYWQVIS